MSTTTTEPRLLLAREGDLILIPDDGGWRLAVVNQGSPCYAVVWDTEVYVPAGEGKLIGDRDVMKPEAGKFVGQWKETLPEWSKTLYPFRCPKPEYDRWRADRMNDL